MPAPRHKKIGHRRRVEDEGDDDAADALDLDDDSLTDGSVATDDHGAGNDSDTSNVDDASPTAPSARKKSTNGASSNKNGSSTATAKAVSDTEIMLQGLSVDGHQQPQPAGDLELDQPSTSQPAAPKSVKSPTAPVVVSSASAAARDPPESSENRRREEHDNYRRKRDADPAFVPNRGSFFMHDHRHAGPAANGFRPFGRGRGRGGGRGGGGAGGGFGGGPLPPVNQVHHRPGDPTTSVPWTHDMHEAVAGPSGRRPRQVPGNEGPPNGNGFIPTREPNPTPINRSLSTEKHIANVQVRILLPHMKAPIVKAGHPVKQYTKLPDHRPPLRRDKPVRISLPNRPPRYVYPAPDRSFIFIPRAMRPNQQRSRGGGHGGKPRSAFGSVGGMSRRTSIMGGSFYGSMYSPSVAVSRRSSIAHERDMMFSPTGSVMSRSAAPVDHQARPVVRLPPAAVPDFTPDQFAVPPPVDYTQPQFQPQPQARPHYQGSRPGDLPMHQPRPQKNISVADIETPAMAQGPPAPFQQAFHQQVPMPVANGHHTRHPSHMSQPSAGTPLSHIPERAIHAAPFQPHAFGQPQVQPQPGYYPSPGYAQHQPQPQVQPQGYYYPNPGYATPDQSQSGGGNLVAQEANGMVYYYDPAQMAPPPPPPSYAPVPGPAPGYHTHPQHHHGHSGSHMGGGMVTPSPDGYYYAQAGMVYYPQ